MTPIELSMIASRGVYCLGLQFLKGGKAQAQGFVEASASEKRGICVQNLGGVYRSDKSLEHRF